MKPIRRNIGCMGGINKGLNWIKKNQQLNKYPKTLIHKYTSHLYIIHSQFTYIIYVRTYTFFHWLFSVTTLFLHMLIEFTNIGKKRKNSKSPEIFFSSIEWMNHSINWKSSNLNILAMTHGIWWCFIIIIINYISFPNVNHQHFIYDDLMIVK